MGCAAPKPLHWEDLRDRPQELVLGQAGVKLAENASGYEVSFLNARYLVDTRAEMIREIEPKPERPLSEEFQILLIRYLVAPDGGRPDDNWISEKDLPGGVTFFQGPHTLHVRPIEELFGANPAAFEARGKRLGACVAGFGDKAMTFQPFPLIPVTYVLWQADEEFPASVTVMFDSSISRWFELDMVFALVLALTERIVENRGGTRVQ